MHQVWRHQWLPPQRHILKTSVQWTMIQSCCTHFKFLEWKKKSKASENNALCFKECFQHTSVSSWKDIFCKISKVLDVSTHIFTIMMLWSKITEVWVTSAFPPATISLRFACMSRKDDCLQCCHLCDECHDQCHDHSVFSTLACHH